MTLAGSTWTPSSFAAARAAGTSGVVGTSETGSLCQIGRLYGLSALLQRAIGVHYVLVNGKIVINHERHTGARPGQIILGPGATRQVSIMK